MKTFFIFCIILISVYSCTKKEPVGSHEYVGFYYEQTICNDPWDTSSNDSITLTNVAAYLNAHTLYFGGLSILKTGTADVPGAACNAKTGKTIYLTTLNSHNLKKTYTDMGFKQQ